MYRKTQMLTFLLIGFTLTGCDAIYRLLDKEGAQEKALIGDIIPFEANEKVEEVQALLYLYGYNTGKVDGVLGLRTRNALEEFQEDNGLKSSRFIDEATWNKLCVFRDNELVIKRQLNVQLVQKLLKVAGFDAGPVDGKMGERTKEAILAFQKAHNLKADGKIGYQTLTQLADYLPKLAQPTK